MAVGGHVSWLYSMCRSCILSVLCVMLCCLHVMGGEASVSCLCQFAETYIQIYTTRADTGLFPGGRVEFSPFRSFLGPLIETRVGSVRRVVLLSSFVPCVFLCFSFVCGGVGVFCLCSCILSSIVVRFVHCVRFFLLLNLHIWFWAHHTLV